VALLDVGGRGLLDLLGLLGAARRALLTAVVASHYGTSFLLGRVEILVPTVHLGTDERDHERMDLDSVADELYGLPPEEFTVARDTAAKGATEASLKKAIKALRKPTASAHEVNRVVRTDPDTVDAVLALGDQLRDAMRGTGDVRRLTEQRRELISTLVSPDLPANVRDDVTATFEAATADPQIAAAVRSGRLVKPVRYAGFGAMPDLEDAVATTIRARPAPRHVKTQAPVGEKPARPQKKAPPANEKPEPDLTALRQRVLELAGVADDAQRRYDEAARAVTEARKVLEGAETERSAAHKAAREAHAAADKARRELGRLERS
jgi:hypothetical protein